MTNTISGFSFASAAAVCVCVECTSILAVREELYFDIFSVWWRREKRRKNRLNRVQSVLLTSSGCDVDNCWSNSLGLIAVGFRGILSDWIYVPRNGGVRDGGGYQKWDVNFGSSRFWELEPERNSTIIAAQIRKAESTSFCSLVNNPESLKSNKNISLFQLRANKPAVKSSGEARKADDLEYTTVGVYDESERFVFGGYVGTKTGLRCTMC